MVIYRRYKKKGTLQFDVNLLIAELPSALAESIGRALVKTKGISAIPPVHENEATGGVVAEASWSRSELLSDVNRVLPVRSSVLLDDDPGMPCFALSASEWSLLPKLDGLGVLQALKNDPRTRNIPVAVLTGLGQKNEGKLRKEGAAYLTKSDSLLADNSDTLLHVVESVLGKQVTENTTAEISVLTEQPVAEC
jgi:CheY-like chemotaxis protein